MERKILPLSISLTFCFPTLWKENSHFDGDMRQQCFRRFCWVGLAQQNGNSGTTKVLRLSIWQAKKNVQTKLNLKQMSERRR